MWCDQHLCKQCNKHGDNCAGEHAYCVIHNGKEEIVFCEDFIPKEIEEMALCTEVKRLCEKCKNNDDCGCRFVPTSYYFGGELYCKKFEPKEDKKLTFDLAPSKENDHVNHPSYYTDGKIEVIDFIEDKKLGFHLGNAVKYVARAGKKYTDKVEDLRKAIWYINRYIELLKEKEKEKTK